MIRGHPRILPAYVRIRTTAISTEESYCPSSLVSVERPLRRDRSTIRPLGFAERILRDLSILFLSSAIRLSLNMDKKPVVVRPCVPTATVTKLHDALTDIDPASSWFFHLAADLKKIPKLEACMKKHCYPPLQYVYPAV